MNQTLTASIRGMLLAGMLVASDASKQGKKPRIRRPIIQKSTNEIERHLNLQLIRGRTTPLTEKR